MASPPKFPTGISGLDEISAGGLPRHRTTLLMGGPGSGKTVLTLQMLVNGARDRGEPAIFVAFEESSRRIIANTASFGWNLPALQKRRLFFLDAQPDPELVPAGGFDLGGLLAALDVKVKAMGATIIAFDAIDMLLGLLDDPAAEKRELHRLHQWLLARNLTAIITAKATMPERETSPPYGFLAFMVDCAIDLNHTVVTGVSQRNLRIHKYRGSAFAENAAPLVITATGIDIAGSRLNHAPATVSDERISTGVERLDAMLNGGYFRNASILVTGAPGTSKTTLAGAFAAAACARGENVLFTTFDSEAGELVRNLRSVGIRLDRAARAGRLHFHVTRSGTHNADVHFINIKAAALRHGIRCLVIDPISALAKIGNELTAHSVIERLIDWAKAADITVLCTSLISNAEPAAEATDLQISTIADTWLHLGYVVHAGERNRSLTIVKSRGTAHSNQVRELILRDDGITLADVYTAGGHVLMGTLRWEKEQADRADRQARENELQRKHLALRHAEEELESRLSLLQRELAQKREERAHWEKLVNHRDDAEAAGQAQVQALRHADPVPANPARPRRRRS